MSPSDEINAYRDSTLDETDRLIVYLESLVEEGVLEDDHLSSFILELEEGKVLDPFKDQGGSAAAIQGAGIQEHIDRGGLDKDRLLKWARLKRAERNRIWVVRNKIHGVTQDIYQKMEFHPVRVGSYQMGRKENKVAVRLTYPIEVMSTQVTQKHWVEIMGENPSHFKNGEHSIVVPGLNGQSIMLQPDHPVESVTWWSTLVFANRLSEKHGFKPAYDLSEIEWVTYADGSLKAEGKVQIYANGGVHDPYDRDIYYQTEGYRLPTEAEQEFLLRAGGRANGKYHFGDDDSKLKDYAWYSDNSESKTHPVAELRPLILDGNAFYDLHGNVFEWGWDRYRRVLKGGDNPVGSAKGSLRVIRGGPWMNDASYLHSGLRGNVFLRTIGNEFGFRLVRTIGSPSR